MDGSRIRANLSALVLEMLPVWCYAGIAVGFALLYGAEGLDATGSLYLPIALAMLCMAFGTLAGGIGWFLVNENLVGGFVLGLRLFTALSLLFVAGRAFDAGWDCSGDCNYSGEGLGMPLFVLYVVSPLVSSAALLVYLTRGDRRTARSTLGNGP